MAPIAKVIFATLSVALVVAATLSLRAKSAPAGSPPALTQQQLAELAPPSKPQPPPAKMTAPVNDPSDLPAPPDDDPEDGNGS